MRFILNNNWFILVIAETTLRDKKTKNAVKSHVKDIRIHDFRHSCASLLIDNGANITLVAKYLGHTKIDETLNTYSNMYESRLDSIVNMIEKQNDNYIEYKPKAQLPESIKIIETKSIDDEIIIKPKIKDRQKDDLVL